MNALAFSRHGIEIVREFSPTPKVAADRHKVLQILINLVQNAKQAVSADGAAARRIVIRIVPQGEHVLLVVADSGVGIPPENLTKIFEHGFTTRANGHGFGLHSAANAAREMHGQLSVHSEGRGKGATFTLQLPVVKPVVALRG
jgi:signal transduction histidine kinase